MEDSLSDDWYEDDGSKEKLHKKHKKKKSKKSKHKKEKRNKEKIESKLFSLDVKGDQANYEFDSLYKYQLSNYDFSKNLLFGENYQYKYLLFGKLKKNKLKRTKRYFETKASDEEIISCNSNTYELWDDFVDLETQKMSDKKEKNEPILSTQFNKNQEFTTKLLESPNDIELWKEFIDYQDTYFEIISQGSQSKQSFKNLIDRKLSIVEKALSKNIMSIELMIIKMDLLKETHSSNDLQKLWKQKLFQFPNSNKLWQEYLLYSQTDLLTMSLPKVNDSYRKAFTMLAGLIQGTIRSHDAEDGALFQFILLLTQYVIFLWKAGLTEKASSAMESFLQYNLFYQEKGKTHYEKIFVSNISVIDDEKKFLTKNNIPLHQFPLKKEDMTSLFDDNVKKLANLHNDNKSRIWVELERLRGYLEFAAYKEDPSDCEDTDRIVLFDDISFALLEIKSDSILFQVFLVYLILLGAPIRKNMLNNNIKEVIEKFYFVNSLTCCCHLGINLQDYLCISSILFLDGNGINIMAVEKIRNIFQLALATLKEPYIGYFSQLWFHFESVIFYYSKDTLQAPLYKNYQKVLEKFFKALFTLPDNHENISLWLMYASYEKFTGNLKKFEKVIISSLSSLCQQKTFDNVFLSPMVSIISFFISSIISIDNQFTFVGIDDQSRTKILNSFLYFIGSQSDKISTNVTPQATQLLKLSHLLESNFEILIPNNNPKSIYVSDFLFSYVVFQYIFHGADTLIAICDKLLHSAAVDVHNSLVFILVALRKEVTDNFYYFPLLRKTLEASLLKYPSSLCFNKIYCKIKHIGLDGVNARKLFEKNIATDSSIMPWIYYIQFDQNRLDSIKNEKILEFGNSSTGLYHRVKSTYERLLKNKSFCFSSDLWKKYLKFEIENGSKDNALAVFNKALRYCSGSKELILYACEKLNILQECYVLLTEKEMRIRLFTEEMDLLLSH